MKLIICLALILVSTLIPAAEPKWEYFTVSTLAAASEVKEPQLKAWLKEHRPHAYEKFFGAKKKEESKSKDGDLIGSLFDLAHAASEPTAVAIDYYTNAMAREGWELLSATDHLLIFRREPPKAK